MLFFFSFQPFDRLLFILHVLFQLTRVLLLSNTCLKGRVKWDFTMRLISTIIRFYLLFRRQNSLRKVFILFANALRWIDLMHLKLWNKIIQSNTIQKIRDIHIKDWLWKNHYSVVYCNSKMFGRLLLILYKLQHCFTNVKIVISIHNLEFVLNYVTVFFINNRYLFSQLFYFIVHLSKLFLPSQQIMAAMSQLTVVIILTFMIIYYLTFV